MTAATAITVATLWRYPVKSMQGEELNGADITLKGLLGDREFALVDAETDKVVSAKNPKKWPNFFSFRAAYLSPPAISDLPPVWITLPNGVVLRSDATDTNEKISDYLGRKVTLTTLAPSAATLEQYWPEFDGDTNEISNEAIAGDAPAGSFFDYAALHLITTSSLTAMQQLYPAGRFEVKRFRPNMTIDTQGLTGFVENDWVGKTLKIGDSLKLQITDPCPRCVMPTLAQGDLPQDMGILKHAVAKNLPLGTFCRQSPTQCRRICKSITSGLGKAG